MTAMNCWVAAAVMVTLTGAAQVALIDLGGGRLYGTKRDITWLADMNFGQTRGHSGTVVNADGQRSRLKVFGQPPRLSDGLLRSQRQGR